jgi:hypothetical protein
MRPCSIALTLVGVLLAGNNAFGQYIVTVDYVQRISSRDDSADRREKVASISVLAISGKRFDTKAVMGKETFQVSGIVKPVDEGHVLLDVETRWSKDSPIGRSTRRVSPGIPFDRMLIHAEKSDATDRDAAEIDRQRIRLEEADAKTDGDDVWYRWLDDTFVIGGIFQNRVTKSKRELIRSYYYFRLKEVSE